MNWISNLSKICANCGFINGHHSADDKCPTRLKNGRPGNSFKLGTTFKPIKRISTKKIGRTTANINFIKRINSLSL